MPHKTNRKIIRIGNTSLAVILPASWLRYYNLSYGDNVEVISDGMIKIKPTLEENSHECK
jgi:antitoxin component of MazEF toxin-antitoxin module